MLGVNNCKTREILLRVQELTLEKALDVVRSAEMTEKQLQEQESDSSVDGIGKEKSKSVLKKQLSDKKEKPAANKTFYCRNCGTRHGVTKCPAYGKTIGRDSIISGACAGHERKFMGLKKKPKNTTATQTCLLEPSPPRLKFKMMNVP